ncbi:unnamed protein product [Phaedon cochleariae]|uniref:Coiled-coil domain-containing protein 112 n=1 Tax=Phaedon cochleariae TaxID=80249 RepID=A0A9N9SB89_PHACE|nr:unnamed protein product [Phaedon cochleariae]
MEVNKLNIIQQGLEKSVNSTLAQLKKYQDHEEISNLITELNKERNNNRETLLSTLKETVGLVKNKTQLLRHNKILDITDLRQFKNQMILIQENIRNLKSESRAKLTQLKDEYADLTEDLDYYSEKIPIWSEKMRDQIYTETMKTPLTCKGPKCKEVRDFIEFVHKSKGHENGWRKEDHQLFLKIRQKHKHIDTLAKHLHEALPDISINEIECHEKWYKEYLSLQLNKRKAIKAWKTAKNSATRTKTNHISATNSLEQLCDPPNTGIVSRPHEYIKKMLMEWKLEKQEKLQNALQIEQTKEQRRKEIAAAQRKQHEELKQLVENWKKTRTEIEEQEILQRKALEEKEKRRRAAEANRMIKQFQIQDDLYILKKQTKKTEELKPLRSKSSQLAKRDPMRLLKPTQQWINRVHDENNYLTESVSLSLKNVQKLRIPEWRKKTD